MRLVTRYVLWQIWPPAFLASGVISVVVVGGAVQQTVKEVTLRMPIVQFSVGDITRMSLYSLPALIAYIVPITFLLGILLTFGRLARNNELTAMKAAGIPLSRLVWAVVAAGVALSAVCFAAQDWGMVWAYRQMERLETSELPLRATIDLLPTGVTHAYGDWHVYVGGRDETGMLRDIMVLQPQPGGEATVFYAARAGIERHEGVQHLIMEKGLYIKPSKRGGEMTRVPFDHLSKPIPGPSARPAKLHREGMTSPQLYAAERATAEVYAAKHTIPEAIELRKLRIALAERLAFPLMCLAVAFIAAPIGVRADRSGRSFTFASGVAILGLYFVLRKVAEPAFIPSLPVALAMAQIPNAILLAAGSALIWRVDRI